MEVAVSVIVIWNHVSKLDESINQGWFIDSLFDGIPNKLLLFDIVDPVVGPTYVAEAVGKLVSVFRTYTIEMPTSWVGGVPTLPFGARRSNWRLGNY